MLEGYVRFIVRHRVAVVVAILAVTALFAAQLRHLRLEIRRRAQLPQDHPYVQIQNEITERFGGETTLVIGIVARNGDIFTPSILEKVIRITRELEALPGLVPGNLLGLASSSAKSVRLRGETLDVHPLLESVPADATELARLKADILSHELYKNILVSHDGRATAILADFDDSLTDEAIYRAVTDILASADDDQVDIALGGAPLVRVYSGFYTRKMAVLFPLCVIVLAGIQYAAFRALQAAILPLLTALLAVVWSLGIISALGQPLDVWAAITPVVVLAIAAGHAVQLLKRYYEECPSEGPGLPAVVRSVCAVGPVMLTAGLIAAAGFASLASFGVTSVRAFGLLLAGGILSTLIIEMTFIPACRSWFSGSPRSGDGKGGSRHVESRAGVAFIERMVVQYPKRILLASSVLLLCCLAALCGLRIDNSLKAWFPESSQLRIDDRILNEHFGGTSTLYILLRGEKEGALQEPSVLQAVSDLESWLGEQAGIGAMLSVADLVAELHATMTGEKGLPDTRGLVAQYLMLYSFSGPDALAQLIDPEQRHGVLRAFVKDDGARFAKEMFLRLRKFAETRFAGLEVQPEIAGGALGVQAALNEKIVVDKLVNLLQVAGVIWVLSAAVFGSLAGGVLVLAPLVLAVGVTWAVMSVLGTPLSIATASFTAMAVGIGADFAIYVIFRLREELGRTKGDFEKALCATLRTCGHAIFYVSAAIVSAYLVLTVSGFRVWVYLGGLTALMIGVAAVGSVVVVPAIVGVARPRFLWRGVVLSAASCKEQAGAREVGWAVGKEGTVVE